MSANAAVVSYFLAINTNATVSKKKQGTTAIPTFVAQSISYVLLYSTMSEEQKSVSLVCTGKNLQSSVVSIQNRFCFDKNSSSDIAQKFRSLQTSRSLLLTNFHRLEMAGRDLPQLNNRERKSLRKQSYSRKHSNSR